MQSQPILAFIGAGNMAASLIGGLIEGGYDPQKIVVSNPSTEKLIAFKSKFSVKITEDNLLAAQQADVIILAVKPNKLSEVCQSLKKGISKKQLLISVAAGIRTQQIQQWVECDVPIIRCMPNTPALLGAGATGLFANPVATQLQREFAESMFRSVGVTVWVNLEEQIDTITALSASGPAYFLLIFEYMIQAGIQLGLDEKQASLLTLQTALGAARMALENKDPIAELRNKVTSPGGTTERAIQVLQNKKLDAIILEAVSAAKNRAKEMSELFDMNSNSTTKERKQ